MLWLQASEVALSTQVFHLNMHIQTCTFKHKKAIGVHQLYTGKLALLYWLAWLDLYPPPLPNLDVYNT